MENLKVDKLGQAEYESTFFQHPNAGVLKAGLQNKTYILKNIENTLDTTDGAECFEKASLPEKIFFNPESTRAAIVTCGGICPGLNDVIRTIVLTLYHWYQVKMITGIKFGYAGLSSTPPAPPIQLNPEIVSNIHDLGGTILGSSRGCPDIDEMLKTLKKNKIDILFCVGGDGTLRGAYDIAEAAKEKGLKISIIGIPKTIDNDVTYVYRSFGFQTAVAEAKKAINCAHVEAKSAYNGIGLVKLMGRDAGFIAASATIASGDVNFCLVPELPLKLDGPDGFLHALVSRIMNRNHAVIAVAEGAGTDLIGNSDKIDASGNKLHNDIGLFLKNKIHDEFKLRGIPFSIKYIDPSYIIRSVPANSDDSIFCADLARAAVHAAMEGKTNMLVGYWHGEFTNVPLAAIHNKQKRISTTSQLWHSVIASTGQPPEWV